MHQHRQNQAVVSSFFSDDRKPNVTTTTAHIKRIIELFNKRHIIYAIVIIPWKNIDGCA